MDPIVDKIAYSEPVLLAVGAILLLFGRKLYWLALGALGFLAGLFLVDKYMSLSGNMELAVAAVMGLAGIVFAIFLQKLAVTLGGFALGALVAYYLATPFAEQLQYQIWWVALVGAVLGVCFAAFLFNAALVLVSAVLGGLLVASGLAGSLSLERTEETIAFVVATVIGVVIQTRGKKAPKTD